MCYAAYTVSLGRAREAEELMRRAVEADPLAVVNRSYLALILEATGRAQEAQQEYRQILELDENFHLGWSGLGREFAGSGTVWRRCQEGRPRDSERDSE